jgi:hypothetical protein
MKALLPLFPSKQRLAAQFAATRLPNLRDQSNTTANCPLRRRDPASLSRLSRRQNAVHEGSAVPETPRNGKADAFQLKENVGDGSAGAPSPSSRGAS